MSVEIRVLQNELRFTQLLVFFYYLALQLRPLGKLVSKLLLQFSKLRLLLCKFTTQFLGFLCSLTILLTARRHTSRHRGISHSIHLPLELAHLLVLLQQFVLRIHALCHLTLILTCHFCNSLGFCILAYSVFVNVSFLSLRSLVCQLHYFLLQCLDLQFYPRILLFHLKTQCTLCLEFLLQVILVLRLIYGSARRCPTSSLKLLTEFLHNSLVLSLQVNMLLLRHVCPSLFTSNRQKQLCYFFLRAVLLLTN
mmetsp:Transcript_85631/g.164839  ORF Transcript_85631/g.164839 Transcript_85631/m.164839 type:complete len:252 (-) Transcript_85631:329-1084(-)